MQLKDGSNVSDSRLDRIYQLDYRSLAYSIADKLSATPDLTSHPPKSQYWVTGGPLDQGQDGACVGFSSAHDLLASPTQEKMAEGLVIDDAFAKEKIYWEAQKIDEWPGGSYPGATPVYEGTSVLAAAKVLKAAGIIDAYHWALNIQQLAMGVAYDGPCVFAYNWYNNMFHPDQQGFVYPGGGIAGGHATLVYGVQIVPIARPFGPLRWDEIDMYRSYLQVENSWGKNWGLGGKFRLHLRDAAMLLSQQGDAAFFHKLAPAA